MRRLRTVRGAARAARRLLIEHGWIKGSIGSKDRGFCLVGAINEAAVPGIRTELRRRVGNILFYRYLWVGMDLGWNDRRTTTKTTTKRMVLDVLAQVEREARR